MPEIYNVYCDESRHLERDAEPVMLLGAVWCPISATNPTASRLREIKADHGVSPHMEIKWSNVSPGKLGLYLDLVDYFFDTSSLHFRAVIIDKDELDHERFDQEHDDFYYKMYFNMLKVLLDPEQRYRIYLDIKDTRSAEKVEKLHEVLSNNLYDFSRSIIQRVQSVRSHEVEQIQLADLLLGAVGYANAGYESSDAKLAVVDRLRERSGYELTKSTLLREDKVNLLRWRPDREAL
jgi:hypothetical protein